MHLFHKNKNVELFNSLQIIRLQNENGEGIQSLIANIAQKNYGYVSYRFKEIIRGTERGLDISKSIENVQNSEKNKYFKYLLDCFKLSVEQGLDLSVPINEIEQRIMVDQKTSIDHFVTKTNNFSMFAIYTMFIPFFYILAEIINWVFTDFMEVSNPILTDDMRKLIFIGNTIAIGVMVLLLRVKDE